MSEQGALPTAESPEKFRFRYLWSILRKYLWWWLLPVLGVVFSGIGTTLFFGGNNESGNTAHIEDSKAPTTVIQQDKDGQVHITSGAYTDTPKPRFIIENPFFNPNERSLRIKAENQAAMRKEPLHIQYDGFELENAGTPLPNDFVWFVALNILLADQPKFLKDGKHEIAFRFSDHDWSEVKHIQLSTTPPRMATEIESMPDGEDQARIVGTIQPKKDISGKTIKVNLYIHHLGEPDWIELDILRKVGKAGKFSYVFATPILKIPQIPEDDPRYTQKFFVLEVIDQAGTPVRTSLKYDYFTKPGTHGFGIETPNEQADIEIVREWHEGKEGDLVAQVTFTPVTRPTAAQAQHHHDFNLRVNQFAQNLKTINTLHWSGLPPDKGRDKPLTIILRNDEQIAATYDNSYTDIQASESEEKIYEVAQRGSDGVLYKSNAVRSPFPPETFTLTVHVVPADSTIRLLGSEVLYTPGIALPIGDYLIEVIREGYQGLREKIAIVDQDVILDVDLEQIRLPRLTIKATPPDSRIRIMNIQPKYQPGMQLEPGRYNVLVEREGFQTYREWVVLGESDKIHELSLRAVYDREKIMQRVDVLGQRLDEAFNFNDSLFSKIYTADLILIKDKLISLNLKKDEKLNENDIKSLLLIESELEKILDKFPEGIKFNLDMERLNKEFQKEIEQEAEKILSTLKSPLGLQYLRQNGVR